jgi:hypothetical protein
VGNVLTVLYPVAAALQVHLLPHYPFGAGTDAAGDQAMLSLLITLRKFIINCANLPEPDRELGVHVALAAEALLTRLVSSAASATAEQLPPSSGPADSLVCTGDQALLLRHAMQQLLPAIQVRGGVGYWAVSASVACTCRYSCGSAPTDLC